MLLGRHSDWGTVEDFFDDLKSTKRVRVISIDSDVWDNLQTEDLKLVPGDGFVFYHTRWAEFPRADPYHRLPEQWPPTVKSLDPIVSK